jgi:hypothetical protein
VVNVPGTVEPEKFVLLAGHYDSWDVGVGDNATGDAAMLEIARVLWHNRGDLRRSVRIAWWPGHSTGRYAGSAWYADAFALDLDENCVAQVNCDSPGCRWADVYENVAVMSEANGLCTDVIREVADLPFHGERPLRAGDYSFNNIGLSSFFMLSSTMTVEKRKEMEYYTVGGCGGNIAWHTENDLMDIADRDILIRDIKVYLAGIMAVANAPILPFDWRATSVEFKATLEKYQRTAGDDAELPFTRVSRPALFQRRMPMLQSSSLPASSYRSTTRAAHASPTIRLCRCLACQRFRWRLNSRPMVPKPSALLVPN